MFQLSIGSFCRAADNTRSLQLPHKSVPVYRWKGALLAGPKENLRYERWRTEQAGYSAQFSSVIEK